MLSLDVVIDDGGHSVEQQIVTLEETLPYLRRAVSMFVRTSTAYRRIFALREWPFAQLKCRLGFPAQ